MLARYAPANAMLSDNGPAVLDLDASGSARPTEAMAIETRALRLSTQNPLTRLRPRIKDGAPGVTAGLPEAADMADDGHPEAALQQS